MPHVMVFWPWIGRHEREGNLQDVEGVGIKVGQQSNFGPIESFEMTTVDIEIWNI